MHPSRQHQQASHSPRRFHLSIGPTRPTGLTGPTDLILASPETWAHYLHVVDSLDTALSYGLRGEDVEAAVEPFSVADLYDPQAPDAQQVLLLLNGWVQLTTVLNELARSMGQHDFYPFVMSRPVLKKIHFIQIVVKETREQGTAPNK